jgi:hypothetical protein
MIRFSHTFNAEMLGIGNLLKVSVPIIFADKPHFVRIDHTWWDGHNIKMYAEICSPGVSVRPDDFTKKYKEFAAPGQGGV